MLLFLCIPTWQTYFSENLESPKFNMSCSELSSFGTTGKPTILLICTEINYPNLINGSKEMTHDHHNVDLTADLIPVAVFHSRITNGCQDGQVLLELYYLACEAFGYVAWPRK